MVSDDDIQQHIIIISYYIIIKKGKKKRKKNNSLIIIIIIKYYALRACGDGSTTMGHDPGGRALALRLRYAEPQEHFLRSLLLRVPCPFS